MQGHTEFGYYVASYCDESGLSSARIALEAAELSLAPALSRKVWLVTPILSSLPFTYDGAFMTRLPPPPSGSLGMSGPPLGGLDTAGCVFVAAAVGDDAAPGVGVDAAAGIAEDGCPEVGATADGCPAPAGAVAAAGVLDAG